MSQRITKRKQNKATIEKQAYKLYIIDGWQRFESMKVEDLNEKKIWVKECFGNKIAGFKLSRANIDHLVEVAERNGLPFSNKRKIDKSQFKIGPGRRLYDGLVKLVLNTNLHNLESLARILELSQSRVFQKTPDFDKYRKLAQKKEMKEEYINLQFVIPYRKRNSVNFLKKLIELLQGVVNVEYIETETERRWFNVQISVHADRKQLFDIINTLINKVEILDENYR